MLKVELPMLTGLAMGQNRSIEELRNAIGIRRDHSCAEHSSPVLPQLLLWQLSSIDLIGVGYALLRNAD